MKAKRLLIITGLMISVLFSLQAIAAEPIKVGAPDPLTGYYASDGNVMLNATKMAVADINARGGLLGRLEREPPAAVLRVGRRPAET